VTDRHRRAAPKVAASAEALFEQVEARLAAAGKSAPCGGI